MASSIVRKITTKIVAGSIDLEELLACPDKRMPLMRVWGFAAKAKPDSSDMGPYVKFSGQFRATSLRDGEEYSSGTLILPGPAQDLLAGALDNEAVDSVQFGFEVSVHYDKEAVTKYVYDVKSLMKPAEDDPLERLSAEIQTLAIAHKPAAEKSVDETVKTDGKKK